MRLSSSLVLLLLLALSFSSELRFAYAIRPSVSTAPPVNVTDTSATLRGNVNPNGKPTLADFITDALPGDPGYFYPTSVQNVGSGNAVVAVEFTITGLKPDTQYRCMCRASNADGTETGGIWPFKTNPATQVTTSIPFDFTLMLSPSSLTVAPGETARFQISISYSHPSYSGTSISIQVTGIGPGMNYQVIPVPASLNVMTSQSTPPGSYPITIIGSAMGVMRQTSVILVVQSTQQPFDFSISASPAQQTAIPGASVTYTITVSLVSGTSQNVMLTVSGAPAGISPSLNPTSGTPTFSSILTVSTSSTVAPGQYTMTVTGTAGAKTQTATVVLIIGKPPDFRIDVTPSSQTVTQGQTTSFSVSVVALDAFNSQVSLSVTGLPTGVSGVFSLPSSKPAYSSTLTIAIPGNSPTGSFTLTITGSGGGITRVANVILTVNSSQTSVPSGILETLQQNSMVLVAVLALLVVLLGALAMRNRGRQTVTKQKGESKRFCGKCGTENPASNEFCMNCGRKLESA